MQVPSACPLTLRVRGGRPLRQDGDVGVRDRLHTLGLTLLAVPKMPPGVVTTFSWVGVHGDRVMVSGHGPQNPDGSPAGPFGRVPDQVSLQQAQESARLAASP